MSLYRRFTFAAALALLVCVGCAAGKIPAPGIEAASAEVELVDSWPQAGRGGGY